jgi:hypothetical protein
MTDVASHAPSAASPATRTADATFTAALVFVAFAALLSVTANNLLHDPDTWWHVAIGRQIAETRSFPWTDTFSHTFLGQPWIAKEWLSQLLLFGAFAIGGWPGVALLAVVAIAASFALLLGWLLQRVRWTIALALTILAAALAAPHFLARPHVFSWPLLVLWVAGLLGAAEGRKAPSWWLLPVVVLWSNLHASVLLAFAIALPLGLEATAGAEPGRRFKVLLGWAVFGIAAILAAMISPYGPYPLVVALRLFGSGESLSYIAEWQPLGLNAIGALAVALLAAALVSLGLEARRNAFRIVLVLLLAYMAARYSRFVSLFAIVSVMVVASPLAKHFPPLRGTADAVEVMRRRLASSLVVAGGIAASIVLVSLWPPRPDPRMAPEAALAAARERGVSGNVFNSYNFGGYLIFEGVPTFIDGRSDQLFLGGFSSKLASVLKADDGSAFFDLLERYDVTWALVESDSDAARHFADAGKWRRVYADSIALVYVLDR